jgi:pilus assembly protein Flp/PilA
VKKLVNNLRGLRKRRDDGASAVEYGLLVALIALVIGGALWALGSSLNNKLTNVNNCVQNSQSGCATP